MGTETDVETDDRLTTALERLTRIQRSILELNQEAMRIRRHIKDYDLNVDALNILATVRSKDEKGGGVQVLQDLLGYARQTGTQLEAYEVGGTHRTGTPRTLDDSVKSTVERSVENAVEKTSRGVVKLLSQLVIALVVTSGLFALIH